MVEIYINGLRRTVDNMVGDEITRLRRERDDFRADLAEAVGMLGQSAKIQADVHEELAECRDKRNRAEVSWSETAIEREEARRELAAANEMLDEAFTAWGVIQNFITGGATCSVWPMVRLMRSAFAKRKGGGA